MPGLDVGQAERATEHRDHRHRDERLHWILAEVREVRGAEDRRGDREAAVRAEPLLELGLDHAAEQRLLADADRREQARVEALARGESGAAVEVVAGGSTCAPASRGCAT